MPNGNKVEMVSKVKSFGLHQRCRPQRCSFVHFSAVERAGLGSLKRGPEEVSYERRQEVARKTSAANCRR